MGRKKTKFLIFGQGRSGSTLLQYLLNAHPEIKCYGELFHERALQKKRDYKKHMIEIFPMQYLSYCRQRDCQFIYGFKLLYYQFLKREKKLRSIFNDNWKIIYLRRDNVINRCISDIVANQSGVYFNKDSEKIQGKTIVVDPDTVLRWIDESLRIRAQEKKMLENSDHIEVVYEHMLENQKDWPSTMKKVFAYLGTNYVPVTSGLQKTHPRPYSEIVSNYDELIEAVRNSEFAYMLEEIRK